MTRWHGITIASWFAPLAVPTARTARGRPTARASSRVAPRFAGRNRQQRVPDGVLERRAAARERCLEASSSGPRNTPQAPLRSARSAPSGPARCRPCAGAAAARSRARVRAGRRTRADSSARSSATAVIGPSGVSSQAANNARVERFAGGAPMIRANASRKPLGLSKPASSCASMTRSPARIALNAEPSRRARAYSTKVMPKRLLELAPRRRGVHGQRVEVGVAPALQRLALDGCDEPAHDVGGLVGMRQRPAARARPVGREQRRLRVGEELAVLALRLARRARRAAEDAGGPHADVEDAVVVGVAAEQGGVAAVADRAAVVSVPCASF